MSKAFTKETDNDSDDADAVGVAALPPGVKNYITPLGYAHLRAELKELVEQERPKLSKLFTGQQVMVTVQKMGTISTAKSACVKLIVVSGF